MEDIWRLNNPNTLTYSSPSRQNRIAYGFVDTSIVDESRSYSKYIEPVHGDHLALTVILEPKDTKHGRPKWKFSRKLASDSQYKTFIEEATGELLQHWSNTPQLNLGISWLKWKKWIRRETKDYYKQFKHSRLQTLHEANILMRTNKAQYLLGEITQQQYNISKDVHKEIRAQYHEFNMDQRFEFHATQMEAPTKFFFRKPRDTVAARTISEVKDTEGTMQTKQSEIEKTFVEHWTRIMNTENTTAVNQHETQTKMWSNIESKLSDDEAKWLDDELTPADFTASIKCQSNNKSPGPDGFAAEFFKMHPVNFGKILHKLFQYQFERQALLKPQQTSLITLLPKTGDPTYAGNYRPIALLPLEIKILTKIFTNRLKHL
ncbi:hypothetical protein AeMF1_008709, partial [Aphanomyces euteiches]